MDDTADRFEIFGKRGWYYSYGAFLFFDAVLHFFCAFILLKSVWTCLHDPEFSYYASKPEVLSDLFVIILGVCYCAGYGLLCLGGARYCLERLLKKCPVMLVSTSGVLVDNLFEQYSIDWKNVSSIRPGRRFKSRYTAISLKSEGELYTAKHAPWTKLYVIANKIRDKAPIVIWANPVLSETQPLCPEDFQSFYQRSQDSALE